jgi:hypothetical protein
VEKMIYGPKKNAAFTLSFPLVAYSATNVLPPDYQTGLTVAASDFKVSIDGSAFANVTNTPVETPSGGLSYVLALTAAEMNGDVIVVRGVSTAGPPKAYQDTYLEIFTRSATINDLPLATDYTSARAAKLDNLDVAVSSRADGSVYTSARAAKLDNLDVPVSSRADGAAYTGPRAAALDNLDVAVSSRADGAEYTTARAVALDNLDVAVSSRADGSFFTPGRAGKLDNLDVAVSSRAAPGAAMTLAAASIDSGQITAGAGNKLADHTLRRKTANARVSSDGDTLDKRSLLGAANTQTNKRTFVGAQLLIFDETDAGTPFLTFNAAGNSSATPVVTLTPA